MTGVQTCALPICSPTTLTKGRLPSAAGEGVASESDASKGYGIGAKVAIQPGDLVITIVGQATDINVGVVPTVFTTYDTYVEAVHSINPDARTPLPSVMAVEPAAGVTNAQVVNRINAASVDLEALTRADAADAGHRRDEPLELGGDRAVLQVASAVHVEDQHRCRLVPDTTGERGDQPVLQRLLEQDQEAEQRDGGDQQAEPHLRAAHLFDGQEHAAMLNDRQGDRPR